MTSPPPSTFGGRDSSPITSAADAVGRAGAALVEADQPCERPDALEEGCAPGNRRLDLEMGDESGHEHDVEWAIAAHLVRDVHIAAFRVTRVRLQHARSVQRHSRQRNPRTSLRWPDVPMIAIS